MSLIDQIVADKGLDGAKGPYMSDWLVIDQDRIDQFAHATNDPDEFHIDPEFAKENSPYGTTISFGFLTMSLLTFFYRQCFGHQDGGMGLNYGFNRLRLTNTVPVGSRIRGVFELANVEDKGAGRVLMTYHATVEIEGDPKPALVAEWLTMGVDTSGEQA